MRNLKYNILPVILVCACISCGGHKSLQVGPAQSKAIITDPVARIQYYSDLIATKGEKPDYYLERCRLYIITGDYDAALQDAEKALMLDPQSIEALSCKGTIFIHRQRYSDAIAVCTQVIERDAGDAQAYGDRGIAYYMLNKITQSLEDLERSIALKTQDAQHYLTAAMILHRQEHWESALSYYEQALVLNPDCADAYRYRAKIHEVLNNYRGEMEDYRRLIKVLPDDPQPYNERALMYLRKREYSLAMKDLNAAIELDSTYALTYRNRGDMYRYQQQYDLAVQDYSIAVTLQPQLVSPYVNRAEVYYLTQDIESALLDCRTALQNAAGTTESTLYMDAQAMMYLCEGDYHKAVAFLSEAVKKFPKQAALYNKLGEAYFRLGKKNTAIDQWKQALSLHRSYPFASHARALLGFK
jgi:tetratricopeptide (TPR) repeat protein